MDARLPLAINIGAKSLSFDVSTSSGNIAQLDTSFLKSPVSVTKVGGNSNLTVSGAGVISATVGIADGTSQSISGILTGDDGVIIPWNATLHAVGPDESASLSAPSLLLVTAVMHYPPEISFERPIDWIDGDTVVLQRASSPSFDAGLVERTVTVLSSSATYDFGLASITSGVWFFRMAAWRGDRPTNLSWSGIVGMGDDVPPTITSASSFSVVNGSPLAFALTANEAATFTLTGTDASLLEVGSGGTLRFASNSNADFFSKSSYSFTVVATDPSGNVGTKVMTGAVTYPNPIWDPGHKSQYVTLSNGYLTATGTESVPLQIVRCSKEVTTFDVSFDNAIAFSIGFINAVQAIDGSSPGKDNSNGVMLLADPTYGWGIAHSGNGAAQSDFYTPWSITTGVTKLRASYDAATNTIKFFRALDGMNFVQLGTDVTGVTLAEHYPAVALPWSNVITATFGS